MWFKRYAALSALSLLLASAAGAQGVLTMVYPTEGMSLPALKEIFVLGEVSPASTLTINGTLIKVHPKGGYLAIVPLSSGTFTFHCEFS